MRRRKYLRDVDFAFAVLVEFGLEVASGYALRQVAHEEVHLFILIFNIN